MTDPYADVEADPVRYADCSEWLVAEGHWCAHAWRDVAVLNAGARLWPFAWEDQT